MRSFFDTVDAVFVINLDHRTDRWTSFQENWKDIIPADKLIRSSAVVGVKLPGYDELPWFTAETGNKMPSWAGAAGCLLSHRRVISEAQKMGFETVVVMEDDAVPSEALGGVKDGADLVDFLKTSNNWGLIYLGFNKMPKIGVRVLQGRKDNLSIWRIPGALSTHAYVVHKRAYISLLRSFPEQECVWPWIAKYRAIDTWFREFFEGAAHFGIYAVIPRLAVQAGFSSDVATHHGVLNEKIPVFDQPRKVSPLVYALCSMFWRPYAWIKNRLNAGRRFRRARKKGFPGVKRNK